MGPMAWILIPLAASAVVIFALSRRRKARREPTPAELGEVLGRASTKITDQRRRAWSPEE